MKKTCPIAHRIRRPATLIWKSKPIRQVARTDLRPVILASGMQVSTYWIAIWALACAPLGMVPALCETSVLFAVLISTFVQKEGFEVWHIMSAGFITCGISLSRYKP